MILFFLCLAAAALVLQYYMGPTALKQVTCTLEAADYLIEPDTESELIFTVQNRSRIPVFFLKISASLPGDIVLGENAPGTLTQNYKLSRYGFGCYLMPRQQLRVKVPYRLHRRGIYHFSGVSLAAGDLFGLSETVESQSGSTIVVVLPKAASVENIEEPVGGLIGEESVRRFIHEDPILSMGYREYTGREPFKAISWPRTLASGSMMVKQFDHTADRRVQILLSAEGGSPEEMENCFSLARAACERLEQAGIAYSFAANCNLSTMLGVIRRVENGLGHYHLMRILEGLGRASCTCEKPLADLIYENTLDCEFSEGYILIVPHMDEISAKAVEEIQLRTDAMVSVLSGEIIQEAT